MSFLVPSECDYEDAHDFPQLEALYSAKLESETSKNPEKFPWKFEVVPGFFQQADAETNDLEFRYTECHTGRKKSWSQIANDLQQLNSEAPDNTVYKLLICARHGQGFHNYVVDKYGIAAWNEKYYCLGTDGDVEYGPDPMLTDLGLAQAKENHEMWKSEIDDFEAPIPSKFYASPLQRSCWTCLNTWDGLRPNDQPVVIKENLRETIGQNLCDKRSSKTVIDGRFSKYGFETEPGFSEEDNLHNPTRELAENLALRINTVCQEIFDEDWNAEIGKVDKKKAVANSVISTTTHAGTIRSFIVVLGHRRFTLSTGGMIPIVVKATRL